jgi:hypothetical protein
MSVIYARCAEQAAWPLLLRETAIAGFGQTSLGARQLIAHSLRRCRFMEAAENHRSPALVLALLPDGHSSPKVNVPDLVSSKSRTQRSV